MSWKPGKVSWLRVAQLGDRPLCLYLAFLFYTSPFAFQQNACSSKPEYMSLETLNSEDMIISRVPGKRNYPLGKPDVSACWNIHGGRLWHKGLITTLQRYYNKKMGLCYHSKGQEKLARDKSHHVTLWYPLQLCVGICTQEESIPLTTVSANYTFCWISRLVLGVLF